MDFLESIRACLAAWQPVNRIIAAVSGGADSTALLLALAELRGDFGYALEVAHVNHGLRGAESDADEAFVRELAESLDCPYHVHAARIERGDGRSVEMAARDERHRYFRSLLNEPGDRMALGHTLDDQAELVLMRLIRGSSERGLSGMRPVDGPLLRPMLELRHADAVAFLHERGQEWREDSTNASLEHQRNQVRHRIMPLLRELNPSAEEAMARTANRLGEVDAFIQGELAISPAAHQGPLLRESVDDWLEQAPHRKHLLNHLVYHWLCGSGLVDPAALDSEQVIRIAGLLMQPENRGAVTLHPDCEVSRERSGLVIYREGEISDFIQPLGDIQAGSDRVVVAGTALQVHHHWRSTFKKPERGEVGAFPARALIGMDGRDINRLMLRSWRPGDRLRPLGMDGSKKLQDIFTDAGLPRRSRARIPILVCGAEVVWVPGYQVARGWEVTPDAQSILEIRIEEFSA